MQALQAITLIPTLLGVIFNIFNKVPDPRKKSNNTKIPFITILKWGLASFYIVCPSLRESQLRLRGDVHEKDNANKLFGINDLDFTTNQACNVLDKLNPAFIMVAFDAVFAFLIGRKFLDGWKYFQGKFLIAIDGTDTSSSQNIHCPHCSFTKHANGTCTWKHQMVNPVLVHPQINHVLNLKPEFVRNEEGVKVQDCEINAGKRWITQYAKDWPGSIILADDLYAHVPFCSLVISHSMNFIFTCKESSHSFLYAALKNVSISSHTFQDGKYIYEFSWYNDIQMIKSDSFRVNWFSMKVTLIKTKEIDYENNFITDIHISRESIVELGECGRARWKIENPANNILKNLGYSLAHNFGHGKKFLSSIFACFILLCHLLHTIQDLYDEAWQKIRAKTGSRQSFFNDLKALLRYHIFERWEDLIQFMCRKWKIVLQGDLKPLNSS